MLPVARIALAPLLILQGRGVRKRALALPEARGARAGLSTSRQAARDRPSPAERVEPMRLLIAGDSSAAGVGVKVQQDALAGQLLRVLHERGVEHVQWRLEAATGWAADDLLRHLSVATPAPFDHAMVVIGVNDVTADRPLRRWIDTLDRIDALLRGVAPQARIVYSGLPPMHLFPLLPQPLRWYLGARARAFDAGLSAWSGQAPHRCHLPLAMPAAGAGAVDTTGPDGLVAADGFHPGPAAYRLWAEQAAGCMLADGPVVRG